MMVILMVEMAIIVITTMDDDNCNDDGQWQGTINCGAKFIQIYFLLERMLPNKISATKRVFLEQKHYYSPFLVHIRPYLVHF